MRYLVQMKLVPQGRPTTSEEGQTFIRQYIFPHPETMQEIARREEDSRRRANERGDWTRAHCQRGVCAGIG